MHFHIFPLHLLFLLPAALFPLFINTKLSKFITGDIFLRRFSLSSSLVVTTVALGSVALASLTTPPGKAIKETLKVTSMTTSSRHISSAAPLPRGLGDEQPTQLLLPPVLWLCVFWVSPQRDQSRSLSHVQGCLPGGDEVIRLNGTKEGVEVLLKSRMEEMRLRAKLGKKTKKPKAAESQNQVSVKKPQDHQK